MTQAHFLSQPERNIENRLIRVAIEFLVAALFTIACVYTSTKIGRLSSEPPNYDDVTYFYDATKRLMILRNEGIGAFLLEFVTVRMHAPFSVLLAIASYAIFGWHVWAPYVGNIIVVFMYLHFLFIFLRQLPLVAQFASGVFFLALPFITMGVVEFRPDIAWAVAVGFGVTYVVTTTALFTENRQRVAVGLLIAAALLIKPSTFAMTILAFGIGCFARLLIAYMDKSERLTTGSFWNTVLVVGTVIAVVAGPYYVLFGDATLQYFIDGVFKNAHIWETRGSWEEQFAFYITGQGGESNLGALKPLLFVIFVVSFTWAMRGKDWRRRLEVLSLMVIIVVVYLVNSVTKFKSPFLGGAFFGMLIFTTACCLKVIFADAHKIMRSRKVVFSVFASIAVLSIFLYEWPLYSNWSRLHPDHIRNIDVLHTKVIEAFEKKLQKGTYRILVTQANPVVFENIGIWAIQRSIKIEFDSAALLESVDLVIPKFEHADFVLTQENNVLGSTPWIPAAQIQDQIVAALRKRADFALVTEITGVDGKKLFLFEHVARPD